MGVPVVGSGSKSGEGYVSSSGSACRANRHAMMPQLGSDAKRKSTYSVHLHTTATAFHDATLTGVFNPIKFCITLKLSSFK